MTFSVEKAAQYAEVADEIRDGVMRRTGSISVVTSVESTPESISGDGG